MVDRLQQEYEGRIEFRLYDIEKSEEGSRLMRELRVVGVPAFVFLDGDGNEVTRRVGAVSEADMRTVLDGLLP